MMFNYRNTIPVQYRGFIDPIFKSAFTKLSKAKRDNGQKELADYISGLMK